ncbi:OsmC family protein [Bacteroidota bacterium]
MENHLYNVALTWKEGRVGVLSSPELPTKIEVATPPEFDKGVPGIWSPEHLFTASVLSCYMTTFLAISEYSKLEFSDFNCSAEGVLSQEEGKFKMTEITLKPVLVIEDEAKRDRALRVLDKAEKACLITNSINTVVHLDATVEISSLA